MSRRRTAVRGWLAVAVFITGGLTATGCGGRAYDPDVDGQSHWWRLCVEDVECGAGLSCMCGVCTKPCDDLASCAGAAARHSCLEQAPWCDVPVGGVCAAACERAVDCPADHRCDDAVCVPELTPSTSSNTASTPPATANPPVATHDAATTFGDGALLDAASSFGSDDSDAGCDAALCSIPPDGFCEAVASATPGDTDAVAGVDSETLERWLAYCQDAGGQNTSSTETSTFGSSLCGNGILDVEGSEQCDDGNSVNGDGCTNDCTIEAGYVCMPPGAPCVTGAMP